MVQHLAPLFEPEGGCTQRNTDSKHASRMAGRATFSALGLTVAVVLASLQHQGASAALSENGTITVRRALRRGWRNGAMACSSSRPQQRLGRGRE